MGTLCLPSFALRTSEFNFLKHNHRQKPSRLPLEASVKGTSRHSPLAAFQTPAPLRTPLKIVSSPPIAGVQHLTIKTRASTGRQPFPAQEQKCTPVLESHSSPHITRQKGAVPCPRPVCSTAGGGDGGISSSRSRPYCQRHLPDTSPAWQSRSLFASRTQHRALLSPWSLSRCNRQSTVLFSP